MINRAMIALAVFVSLNLSIPAHATDYYVCDTGSDSNAGTKAAPFATWDKVRDVMDNTMVAGDNLYLCEGGVFTETAVGQYVSLVCTASQPCEISSYQPDGIDPGDVGVMPNVRVTGAGVGHMRMQGDNEYITFSKIRFTGVWGTTGAMFLMLPGVKHVTFDDIRMEEGGLGFQFAPSGTASNPTEYITIKNSNFYNITGGAFLGFPKRFYFIDNVTDLMGANFGSHALYLEGRRDINTDEDPDLAADGLIAGNLFKNTSPSDIGNGPYNGTGWEPGKYGCGRNVFNAHGRSTRLTVTENTILEDGDTVTGGCWGMPIDQAWFDPDEYSEDLKVYSNNIFFGGSQGAGCSNCDGVIYKNMFIRQNNNVALQIPNRGEDAPNPTTTATIERTLAVIDHYNNIGSFYWGINADWAGTDIAATMRKNIVLFTDEVNTNICWEYDASSTLENNHCFEIDASGNIINETRVLEN